MVVSPRWIKIFRDLWSYKARTLLVVLAIAVGVTAVGLTATARFALEYSLADGFAASHPASAVLDVAPFRDDLVDEIRDLADVQAAEARRVVNVKLRIGPDEWATMELHGIPDSEMPSIGRLELESGSAWPPPKGSLLLERSALHLLDARAMRIGARSAAQIRMPDGKLREVAVAGLVNDLGPLPSNIQPIAYGYISFETLDELDEPHDYNRLYVIAAGNPQDRQAVERIITRVVEEVEDKGYPVFRAIVPEPGEPILGDNLNTVVLLLGALGVLSLALSAFLATNVIAAFVTQQIRQIGVIKALGGRVNQITRLYLQMAVVFGLLALFISVPAGWIGAFFLADFVAGQLDFDIVGFNLPPGVLALQAISAVLAPALAALVPILIGARITVREAISDGSAAKRAKRRYVAIGTRSPSAAMWRSARAMEDLPRLLILAVRNIFRRKARVALTLATLTLGGAMFIAIFGIRLSFLKTLDEIRSELNYDVEIDFDRPYPIKTIERKARQAPGVVRVESWGLVDARRVFGAPRDRVGGSFTLIGLPPATRMTMPSVHEGRWLRPGEKDTIFVNADTLKLVRELSVGGEITLQIGEDEYSWRLVGVSSRLLVPLAYVDFADFERVIGLKRHANRLVVKTERHDPAFQSAVEVDLLDRFDDADIQVVRSETTTDIKQTAAAQIENLVILLMAMAILIVVVGGLGLASTMGLNVMERTREIGVLRAMGAKTGALRRLVIGEGLAIGLISCALGIALSVPLGVALGNALGISFFLRPLDTVFSTTGVLVWIAVVALVATLASLLPAQNAARLTIRETLAYNG